LTGAADGAVTLWDLQAATEAQIFIGPQAGVTSLAFGPGGERFAAGYDDGTVVVWSLKRRIEPVRFQVHREKVTALDFSPDGRWLLSASADDTLVLIDLKTNRPGGPLRGHAGDVTDA